MSRLFAILNIISFFVDLWRKYQLSAEVAKKIDEKNAQVKLNAQNTREVVARLSDGDLDGELRTSYRD